MTIAVRRSRERKPTARVGSHSEPTTCDENVRIREGDIGDSTASTLPTRKSSPRSRVIDKSKEG